MPRFRRAVAAARACSSPFSLSGRSASSVMPRSPRARASACRIRYSSTVGTPRCHPRVMGFPPGPQRGSYVRISRFHYNRALADDGYLPVLGLHEIFTGLADMKRIDLRNVAIIAHVDNGKTTLVDNMLLHSGL